MNKKILVFILILLILFSVVISYKVLTYFYKQSSEEKSFEVMREMRETPDLSSLERIYAEFYNQNPDFAGWISISGTNISYPVMKNEEDPQKYLHLDMYKKWTDTGTPFYSNISDPIKPTEALIIYGHRNYTGTMFEDIYKMSKQDDFDAIGEAHLDTLTKRYVYEPKLVFKTQIGGDNFPYYDVSDFNNKAAFNVFIDGCYERSLVQKGTMPTYGEEILMLSTCEYSKRNGRVVLLLVKTDEYPLSPDNVSEEESLQINLEGGN